VSVWATQEFTPVIRSVGAESIEYSSPLDRATTALLADFNSIPLLLLKEASISLAGLEAFCSADRPNYIVHDVLAWSGWILGTRLGIRSAQTWPVFASNEAFSLHHDYASFDADDSAMVEFNEHTSRFLQKANLQGITVDQFFNYTADRNIVLFPRELQPYGTTFDDRFVFVGPCVRLPEPWAGADWLKDSGPLLAVALGTIYNNNANFYRQCMESSRRLGWRCAIAIGEDTALTDLGDIPQNVRIWRKGPLISMLLYASVFITHGGMSGVVEALYHGVPLAIAPQMGEQAAVADRIVELGLGVRLADGFTAEDTTAAVQDLYRDSELAQRILEMRELMRSAGGSSRFAEEIECDL
jgi:MGT family glycosyltransferase